MSPRPSNGIQKSSFLLALLSSLALCASLQSSESKVTLPKDISTRKSGVDYPTFLGSTGDNRSTEKGIRTDWGRDKLPLVWKKNLGTGYGGPSISRGRLFSFDRVGDHARLQCLNSETGKLLWEFKYPTDYEDRFGYNNGPRCTPVVEGDRVYLFGAEGMLYCLSIQNKGKEIWKVDTRKKYQVEQNFFGVGSTPVIEKDLLLVHIGGTPTGEGKSANSDSKWKGSSVVAFDKLTGKVRYEVGNDDASYASPVLATIQNRRWCLMFSKSGLMGFNPADGKADFLYPWRAKIYESVNASNPIVIGDQVFISETYGPGSSLLKVKPGGYELKWRDPERSRKRAMQTHWNTAIHHEGYIYGSSGRHSHNAVLRCIALKDGEVKWSVPRLSRSSLLYVDQHFVCLTEYGEVFLFKANPEKFEPVTQARLIDEVGSPMLRYPAWAAPVLSHGLLYLRCSGQRPDESRLLCLELIPQKGEQKKSADSEKK